jgi:hypothetical protein
VRLTRWMVVVGMVALSLLAGCGGDEIDVKPTSGGNVATAGGSTVESDAAQPEADTDLPSGDDVEAYFTALASEDPDDLEPALDLAAPGSLAYAYLDYHLQGVVASIDGGLVGSGDAPEVEKIDGGFQYCTDSSDDETCARWTDIEGRNGAVANFKVNDEPLDTRLIAGNGQPVPAGSLGSLELLYAYESPVSDSVYVVARAQSADRPVTVALADATYYDPAGQQTAAAGTYGPTELDANANANIVMIFPTVTLGGDISISMISEDSSTEDAAVLKTK